MHGSPRPMNWDGIGGNWRTNPPSEKTGKLRMDPPNPHNNKKTHHRRRAQQPGCSRQTKSIESRGKGPRPRKGITQSGNWKKKNTRYQNAREVIARRSWSHRNLKAGCEVKKRRSHGSSEIKKNNPSSLLCMEKQPWEGSLEGTGREGQAGTLWKRAASAKELRELGKPGYG